MSHSAYVVDDDSGMRLSLAALLVTHRALTVRQFASGDEFLHAVPVLGPGIVIMDSAMPGSSGIATMAALDARRFPTVILTAHADIALAVTAMRAGAVDFVCKTASPEELLVAADRALADLEAVLRDHDQLGEAAARLARLSQRQREVLTGILDGQRSKAIAADLSISVRTVELHRAQLFRKLGVRSQAELIRLAIAAGPAQANGVTH